MIFIRPLTARANTVITPVLNFPFMALATFLDSQGIIRSGDIGRIKKTAIANEIDNYLFRNGIPLPRGQSVSRNQDMYSMSVNYTLPVWYPDIALGPVLNFQRLRANGFFDYAEEDKELVKGKKWLVFSLISLD